MRIVVELKKDANPNVVLNLLFKHTKMQDTFGVIMLALVNNQPVICNLKQILDNYIDFQKSHHQVQQQLLLAPIILKSRI